MYLNKNKFFDFKNKIVLLTGSSGIIGRSICKAFLESGSIIYGFDVLNSKIKHKNYIHKKFDLNNEKKLKQNMSLIIKNKNKIDFVILGDSHINSFYSLFNKSAKENNKLGLFLGYPGCPPILNVYPLRADQKEKDCYELNQSVFKIINEKNGKKGLVLKNYLNYLINIIHAQLISNPLNRRIN